MNILYINPQSKPATNQGLILEPVDLLQVATNVGSSNRDQVRVVDLDYQQTNAISKDLSDFADVVVFMYDYMIPMHTEETIDNIVESITYLKPETKVILISKSAKYLTAYLNKGIDVLITNNAEDTLSKVLDRYKYNIPLNGIKNIITKQIPLDQQFSPYFLVAPDYSLLEGKYQPLKTIISSRGCINSCNFCPTKNYFGEWYSMSVLELSKVLTSMVQTTDKILFLDDNFTANSERVEQVCRHIRSLKCKTVFGCLASINTVTEAMLDSMYAANFRWIHFGIESLNPEILKKMNKPVVLEKARTIIKYAIDLGFRVRVSFVVDYPGTSADDLYRIQDFTSRYRPHEVRLHHLAYRYYSDLFESSVNSFKVLPKQYIHDELQNIDLIPYELQGYVITDSSTDWSMIETDKETRVLSLSAIKYGLGWCL